MTAVQIPAIGGKPLARAIAKQSGIAMRNTRKPAIASKRTFPNGFVSNGGTDGALGVAAIVLPFTSEIRLTVWTPNATAMPLDCTHDFQRDSMNPRTSRRSGGGL